MSQLPDFDPFELLGVDFHAEPATIDRAYKARIRFVHPDIAGTAGLNETKRLNVAREWLLDPDLRARLQRPAISRREPEQEAPSWPPAPPRQPDRSEPRPWWVFDVPEKEPQPADPATFDFGARSGRLRDFFESIRSLSDDERARVTYSLGDEPPFFFDEFEDIVSERLWERSQVLDDVISRIWAERVDEAPPLLFPRGRVFGNGAVVANAYAQWILLADAISQRSRDEEIVAALAWRCTWAWEASVDLPRYGPFQREVMALLNDARDLSVTASERLARGWGRHFGSYLYGRPGEDWFPGSLDHDKTQLVSARLAAVDASRIEPPAELDYEHQNGFRCGLRLAAYVFALGGVDDSRGYLRPWQEALDASPSFRDRARWGMPLG